jgi:hypothetical protein
MTQIFKNWKQYADCSGRTMEARDHFKNGASLKSQMSRGKFLPQWKIFTMLMLIVMLFAACNKEKDKEVVEDDVPNSNAEMFVVDISSDTEADLLLIHKDGSYALLDMETEYGSPIVYVNSSIDASPDEGYIITMYDNGLPKYMIHKDTTFVFANYEGNKFDMAIIEGDNEPVYYWGLESDFDFSIFLTKNNASIKSKGMSPTQLVHLEYIIKGIGALATVAVVAVSVTPVGWISWAGLIGASAIATTILSFMDDNETVDNAISTGAISSISASSAIAGTVEIKTLQNGTLKFKPLVFIPSLISSIGDAREETRKAASRDYAYNELSNNKDNEYHITLYPYSLELTSQAQQAIVHVNTKSPWEILDGGDNWCSASKIDDNTIAINVSALEFGSSRETTFTIRDPYSAQIPTARLTIKQIAFECQIDPPSLTFEAEGGKNGFTITLSAQSAATSVDKIEVITGNDWCSVTRTGNLSPVGAIVEVEPNEDGKERNALIEITFKGQNHKTSMTYNVYQKGQETGFFAGTAFNNTMWKINSFPITSNESGTKRKSEYHSTSNGWYYTYHTEPYQKSESDYYPESYFHFKGDTLSLFYDNINETFIFEGEDIIYRVFDGYIFDGYIIGSHTFSNGIPLSVEDGDKLTCTRLLSGNNNFKIRMKFESEDSGGSGNYWYKTNTVDDVLYTFEITSDNTIKFSYSENDSMESTYGSEYIGIINYNGTDIGTGYGSLITKMPDTP